MDTYSRIDAQMFQILGKDPTCRPAILNKSELSVLLSWWLRRNDYERDGKIILNPSVSELSGLPDTGEFDTTGDRWWDFVSMVFEKWKL